MTTRIAAMTFAALCLSLMVAGTASAQTSVSDPIPLLNGTEKAKLLYSIPYVVSSPTIATCVSCTRTDRSTDTSPELVGVELFDDGINENDLGLGEGVVALLEGGDTAILCTENATSVEQDSFISPAAQNNDGGTGRVVGTTKNVMCMAFLVSVAGDPPSFMTILPMYKGSKQKGGM